MKKNFSTFIALALAGMCWLAVPAEATSIVFELNEVYAGATPDGPPPWLRATFTDIAAGTVKLELESLLDNNDFLGSNGKVNGWLFNFNPGKTVTNLVFSFQSGTNAADEINLKSDTYGAGAGVGGLDIQFGWASAGRFVAGDTATYLITGKSGSGLLPSASDFDFLDTNNKYHSVAHVQGIGTNGDSGKIGDHPGNGGGGGGNVVPEPGTIVLLGGGLLGMALYGRRIIKG